MKHVFQGAFTLLALLSAPAALAQTVTLYGTLSNFDVVNDTGGEVHGFEIEFYGADGINSYYNWNRYGPPTVTPMAGAVGVVARWMSPWDPASGTFIVKTPQANNPTVMTGHQCVIGTVGYDTSGCEHFGLTTVGNATRIVYHWLIADPLNPGQLTTYGSQVAIAAPVWSVQPPAQPGNPVVVAVDVDPPIPPKPAKLFGDAQWMKTYKSDVGRQVNLDELIADAAVVPEDDAHLETAWDLMQTELGSNSKRKQKRGGLSNGSHAVVRRFEFYKYTGPVDATGKALCADPTCSAPAPGEVGDFIGAQNAAANLNVPAQFPVTVTLTGDGQVSTSNSSIRCPGTCSQFVAPGTSVTLTAKNGKGTFAGWSGACTGTVPTCTLTVNSEAPVTATFLASYKLTTRITGVGTISSNPAGSSFLDGTTVTLTAVPTAGNTFTAWGGACAGTSLTCTLTISADTSVTATFAASGAPPPPPPPGNTTSYRLVVKTNGNGTVAASPAGSSFASGTVVTLTATPKTGSPWLGWSGPCTDMSATCVVTMTADTTVTANFR